MELHFHLFILLLYVNNTVITNKNIPDRDTKDLLQSPIVTSVTYHPWNLIKRVI